MNEEMNMNESNETMYEKLEHMSIEIVGSSGERYQSGAY